MTLDRSIAPAFKPISKVNIPKIEKESLRNGIPVYCCNVQQQEVLKIELVFEAGNIYAKEIGIGALFTKMMLCGTKTLSAQEVINQFDQWGGFAEFSQRSRRLHVSVYGMTRYFEKYLLGIKEIIDHLSFPDDELQIQKKIASQGIHLNNEKPASQANKAFRKAIFGENHPYGRDIEEEDVEIVTRENLSFFHENEVKPYQFKIFLSGDLPVDHLANLEKVFGNQKLAEKSIYPINLDHRAGKEILVRKNDSMQSTLRIGNLLFGKKHPDAVKFQVTNTIFGGYFGSRLMKNIREEKGFTYGISSGLFPVGDDGYFMIGSDIVKENTQATIDEIKKEMSILQNEKVSDTELEVVKNYMIGSFANGVNNSFDIMDKNQKIILGDLPADYYSNYINNIRAVSADDILNMSQKYLNYEDLFEVIIGDK